MPTGSQRMGTGAGHEAPVGTDCMQREQFCMHQAYSCVGETSRTLYFRTGELANGDLAPSIDTSY